VEKLKPIEHWFKATVFSLTRLLLKRKARDFQPLDGLQLKNVLFLRPEKIGDMAISLPVFDGLKKHYPHLKISILGSPKNEALIKDDPRFDRVFMYRKVIWRDISEVLRIRKQKFDCVVDMIGDDSVTALYLSQLCAPGKPRIGVGKVKFREFYDFNYDPRMGNTGHIIQNTLRLLDAFGIDSQTIDCYATPYIPQSADQRAAEFIQTLRSNDSGTPLIGYNLSAGSPTRLWALEKAEELLNRIQRHCPKCRTVLITVPSEREKGDFLASRVTGAVQVPPGLSLLEVSAIISRLDLLISPDTSLVHIARSFHVPVVGLYSRFMKNFLLWKPFGQEIGAVVSGNDGNIHDITVDQVFDAFVKLIETRSPVPR
jgi:ADP-heptose:LPS heptosyltransferase